MTLTLKHMHERTAIVGKMRIADLRIINCMGSPADVDADKP